MSPINQTDPPNRRSSSNMESQVLARCSSFSHFTTKESLQAWIDGKDTDSKSNQKLIKKKIRSTLKPSASFRTYPKLDSLSHFSRKYVSYDDHPHVSRQRKNRKLNRSRTEYTLSTVTTSDPNITTTNTTHTTSGSMSHSGSTGTIPRGTISNKLNSIKSIHQMLPKLSVSKSTNHLLHHKIRKQSKHNKALNRSNTRCHGISLYKSTNTRSSTNSHSSRPKQTVITRSETVSKQITFCPINLAQQHHKRSEKEERRKREVTKHETAKYVSQLYKPLPQWLQCRLGTKPKKDSHWKLLRESLRPNLLTFASKPSLESNTVRFKIKFILHQLPDFSQFRGDNLNMFLDHCELKCIPANTTLYLSGSMGKNCYLILDGSYILRKRSMNRMQALSNLMTPKMKNKRRMPVTLSPLPVTTPEVKQVEKPENEKANDGKKSGGISFDVGTKSPTSSTKKGKFQHIRQRRKSRRKWSKLRAEKMENRIPYDVVGMQTTKEHAMRFEHNFRMTDCICTENSVLLSIPFQNWWFVNRLLDQDKKRNAQFLLQHRDYFRSLSATAQQQITRILKYHKITNGESLYYQDTAANHIYLVVDGEVILNHEMVLQLSNEYPIDHGTTWECKEITRSFHLLVSTLKRGDWFAVESIDENAMNLCTASCISVHGATILSIPKRDLYLFPVPFEQEIRREFVEFFTKIKDAKDAFKVQYLERIKTINDKMGRSVNAHSQQRRSTLKRSLSMQHILECTQRGNDKLMVERKDPLFRSKMGHIKTLRAEMFGPLHLKAVDIMKQQNAEKKKNEMDIQRSQRSSIRSPLRNKVSPKSLGDVVMNMAKYEHGTKHEMRKDSRFAKSNKHLRDMAEKRAKQSFVINKIFRIHREAVDVDVAAREHRQRRGMISVTNTDTGIDG